MEPADFTNINAIGMTLIVLFGIMILILPRRYAIIPILAGICYVSLGQVINISGLHFTSMRLLVLVGWLRIIMRSEIGSFSFNIIDKLVSIFILVSFFIHCILWQTQNAFIYKLGIEYNIIGIYFLCRVLVRDIEDVVSVIRIMSFAVIPITLSMIVEKISGRNLFHFFGAVQEYTIIREGHLRCQGPFTHPILAGTFGVTWMPMFIGLWFRDGNDKFFSLIGVIATALITILCASSGPLFALISVIFGFGFWHFRNNMRVVRWAILISIVTLHIIMKSPVWHLIGRISDVSGGTGWHRVGLIDSAVIYFNEWWIIGTKRTAHWMPYVLPIDPENVDITNQYILVGIEGGIISVLLFLFIIVKCFSAVGSTVVFYENKPPWLAKHVWSLGVSLLAYIVSFISVAMFDFISVYYYMLISFIAVSTIYIIEGDNSDLELI